MSFDKTKFEKLANAWKNDANFRKTVEAGDGNIRVIAAEKLVGKLSPAEQKAIKEADITTVSKALDQRDGKGRIDLTQAGA
jgi:hypothetical protein